MLYMRRESFFIGVIMAYLLVIAGFTLHPQLLYGETAGTTAAEQFVDTTPVRFEVLPDSPDPNEVFKLVNDQRMAEGQKPLVADAKLGAIALERAKDMAVRQYYAHKNPDGKYYYDLFPKYDVHSEYSCENLDIVFVPDATEFIKEWTASVKHHACMVHPKTNKAGFAATKMMLVEYGGKEVPAYLVVGIHSTTLR